jgi:hypothetical protein
MANTDVKVMFAGVYSCDTLPARRDLTPTLYIVNTAPHTHPSGQHWVALTLGLATCEYFDSLGNEPPADFIKFLGTAYTYTTLRLQDINQPTCGYYALFFAKCRASGLSFENTVQAMFCGRDAAIVETVECIRPISTSFSGTRITHGVNGM